MNDRGKGWTGIVEWYVCAGWSACVLGLAAHVYRSSRNFSGADNS
jgi:hypothetical protein